jgi:hypothetical protein
MNYTVAILRQGFVIGLSVVAFAAGMLLLLALLIAISRLSQDLPGPWQMALYLISMFCQLGYFVFAFFGMPQFLLLRSLRTMGFWTRLIVGALSRWFFLFSVFADGTFVNIAQHAGGAGSAFALCARLVLLRLATLVSTFVAWADVSSLLMSLLLGVAFGVFLWAPTYRLSEINSRDWNWPFLGGGPPYSR